MSLYVRNDYHTCPNPLSADSYTTCPYSCVYCFVLDLYETILKNKAKKGLQPVSLKNLQKTLGKTFRSESETKNPVIKALRFGLPVIIGRKSEPFCKSEREHKATLEMLKLLKRYDVPTVVETKGMIIDEKYFKVFSEMNAGVNVTITPGDDKLALKLREPTVYSTRWAFAHKLKDVGLWVGVTGEPIINGVNDSTKQIEEWAENCATLKPTHVNFGDLRVSSLKIMARRMAEAGFDLAKIIRAKKETWVQKGHDIFKLLHELGLLVTTPDWINYGMMNDTESCCGFTGLRFKFHTFTFQHAVLEVKRKGRVTFGEIAKNNIFGEKHEEKFREIWNGKGGYFNLSDVRGVSKLGRDANGDVIYGKAKSLGDVFV